MPRIVCSTSKKAPHREIDLPLARGLQGLHLRLASKDRRINANLQWNCFVGRAGR